jgi:hypothetical protein
VTDPPAAAFSVEGSDAGDSSTGDEDVHSSDSPAVAYSVGSSGASDSSGEDEHRTSPTTVHGLEAMDVDVLDGDCGGSNTDSSQPGSAAAPGGSEPDALSPGAAAASGTPTFHGTVRHDQCIRIENADDARFVRGICSRCRSLPKLKDFKGRVLRQAGGTSHSSHKNFRCGPALQVYMPHVNTPGSIASAGCTSLVQYCKNA